MIASLADIVPVSPRLRDLTGRRVNRLTVLGYGGRRKDGARMWICKCDCGQITAIRSENLRGKATRSCGCILRDGQFKAAKTKKIQAAFVARRPVALETNDPAVSLIQLSRGKFAKIDTADIALVLAYKWCAHTHTDHRDSAATYAISSASAQGGSRLSLKMHRLIAGARDGEYVDHVNGDGLDNRRANLRICSNKENTANKTAYLERKRLRGGYLGVSRAPSNGWRAQINAGEQRGYYRSSIYLGTYNSPEEAARAYDIAAVQHFGEFAALNFPGRIGEPPPVQRSKNPRRISAPKSRPASSDDRVAS